jgi:hypothetical protein
MPGNTRKSKWNKPGGARTSGDMKDAATIEEAAETINRINARTKREKADANAVTKAERDKAKITLPSPESMAKLLKDIKDETEK